MQVLVTGATGFIGRHLVPHLIKAGADVTILVRESYVTGKPLPPPLAQLRPLIGIVYADLRNFNLVVRAVREAAAGYVVHLAAVGATDPLLNVETAVRHNLAGTLNLVRACFESKGGANPPRQLIIARTPGEKQVMNVYAASKAAAWTFCQMYARTQGWPIYGAMIFQAYGPGQADNALVPAAITAAQSGEDFAMTAGVQERDWIYVSDVVEGLQAALGRDLAPGTTFELGTGHLTPVAEVARLIYALVNRGGRPLIGVLPDRPGEEPRQVADAALTRNLIGWEAGVSLNEGLQRFLAAPQVLA